jgi:hypothetical protein
MTEDEARNLCCCGPAGCGEAYEGKTRWCVASGCMAWRFSKEPTPAQFEERETGTDDPTRDVPDPDRKVGTPEWIEVESGVDEGDPMALPPRRYRWKKWTRQIADAKPAQGYCGLAGVPK